MRNVYLWCRLFVKYTRVHVLPLVRWWITDWLGSGESGLVIVAHFARQVRGLIAIVQQPAWGIRPT